MSKRYSPPVEKLLRNYILILLFAIYAPAVAPGQSHYSSPTFKQLPDDLGLNNISVIAIAQDSRGYMWFGTWIGLIRYDGHEIKQYTFDNKNNYGLTSNKIASLFLDSKGDLYVGTILGSLARYRYDSDDFETITESGQVSTLRKNIWSLHEDNHERIWAGTEKGIVLFNTKTDTALHNHDVFTRSNVNSKRVHFIGNADSEYTWIGTDSGIFIFHTGSSGDIVEIGHIVFEFEGYTHEQSNFISHIAKNPDKEDCVFVNCKSGIIEFDYAKGFDQATYKLIQPSRESFVFPRVLRYYDDFGGKPIIGTNDGLFSFIPGSEAVGSRYIRKKIVRTIFKDSFGTIWVGTDSGLFKLNKSQLLLENIPFQNHADVENEVLAHMIRCDVTRSIWIAWQSGSISKIPLKDGEYDYDLIETFQIRGRDRQIVKERISQIASDSEGNIWVATQGAGLLAIKGQTTSGKKFLDAHTIIDHKTNVIDNYVMSIAVNDSVIWLGTWNRGLFKYNRDKASIIPYPIASGEINLSEVPVIHLDESNFGDRNQLLISTRGAGLLVASPNGSDMDLDIHLHASGKNQNKISSDFISDVSNYNELWAIATENGINIYDIIKNEIIPEPTLDELHGMHVQTALISPDQHIWISTQNDGLVEIEKTPAGYFYKTYENQVLNDYIVSSGLIANSSTLLFGGAAGMTRVNLEYKDKLTSPPIPMFTNLRIDNQLIEPGQVFNDDVKLTQVIGEAEEITLNYKDKVISFGVNAMHTGESQAMTYAYKLEGFNEDWIYAPEETNILHFTNLPHESFELLFKASNSDGAWSEEVRLNISVSPPWWQTNLAYFLYALTLALIIFGIIKLYLLRERFRNDVRIAAIEREKLEELNQHKLNFYTSISHELRTPLTMIISPIEQLLRNPEIKDREKSYTFIHRNAQKLLRMVNQLLDFRRHETKRVNLHFRKWDMVEFLHEITTGFSPLANRENISIKLDSNVNHCFMVFDEEEMEKLFNNLISNAIKYTNSGGKIEINIEHQPDKEQVVLHVKDDGKGISKRDQEHIFERFYQSEDHVGDGYGLGLSIVKSIVDLHQGQIAVDSELDRGTSFSIVLPTNLQIVEDDLPGQDSDKTMASTTSSGEVAENEQKTILIVEDSEDIRAFLNENLKEQYNIVMAADGQEGYEMALRKVPHLIISDIAMPHKDGLELARDLRKNDITSHIPIIILTARTTVNYKLEGFDYGINAFITKPFNLDVLQKRIQAMLEYYDLVKSRYHSTSDGGKYTYTIALPEETQREEQFLDRVTNFILENMSDSSLTIENIASHVNMSHVQFYRKIKAICGMTPNSLLRDIRLQRAAQLLDDVDYKVSEVTYAVGFNDLKYFRTQFKNKFGCNPSEYRKSTNKITDNS